MKLTIPALAVILSASLVGLVSSGQQPAKPQQETKAEPQAAEAESEIQKLNETFRKAFDAGDAKAIASTFTADAEITDDSGDIIRGRQAITDHFAAGFETTPKATLKINTESVRLLSPGLAVEDGSSTVTFAEGGSETTRYEAIHVKTQAGWLQAHLREFEPSDISPHERLKPLEWLLGDWMDESPEGLVHSTCKWSEDGQFLLRELHVTIRGRKAMTISQRIGWDPVDEEIKGWVFDSGGGHGTQSWFDQGDDSWLIKTEAVTPDGKKATATNTLTRTGKDSAVWVSADRTLDGEILDDTEEISLVRRPPPPK